MFSYLFSQFPQFFSRFFLLIRLLFLVSQPVSGFDVE